ncbi:MAG: helix-turn-helix transcriptional regulator [Bacteroidales bacterium]|nr:helix-turn-helix transcriptional regulator [Bacteroidales bacterium]
MELEKCGVQIHNIRLGFASVSYDSSKINYKKIEGILVENGFGIVVEREKIIVEQIKQAVVELVHHMNNMDSIVRRSDYLVEKLNMSYQQISKLFSKHESLTLEKFVILNKIEKIKEMILTDEYTLSEIAYMMDYNSVQYLSTQFKTVTGISVTDYKKAGEFKKIPLEDLINEKL